MGEDKWDDIDKLDDLSDSITTRFDKLKRLMSSNLNDEVDELLSVKWPKMNKMNMGLNFHGRVGGWVMKLKIFIGFIQCFCYFPVIFEIPWPPMVLDFMKMLELGKYHVNVYFSRLYHFQL